MNVTAYKSAKTLKQFLALGGTRADYRNDVRLGHIQEVRGAVPPTAARSTSLKAKAAKVKAAKAAKPKNTQPKATHSKAARPCSSASGPSDAPPLVHTQISSQEQAANELQGNATGATLCGHRVTVQWHVSGRKVWYAGTVEAFDQAAGVHIVRYDDGDVAEEQLDEPRNGPEKAKHMDGTN